MVTGSVDEAFVFNFDIMSFDPGDDTNAWLYLEEVWVDVVEIIPQATIGDYHFTSDAEGWEFHGAVTPFDTPLSAVNLDMIGLSPAGSSNAFSYWESPYNTIQDGDIYRVWYEMRSSVSDADQSIQFRLRLNQVGTWFSWGRIVTSNLGNAPSVSTARFYPIILHSIVSDTTDDDLVMSFEIMSFDVMDDVNSWIFLDRAYMEEVDVTP